MLSDKQIVALKLLLSLLIEVGHYDQAKKTARALRSQLSAAQLELEQSYLLYCEALINFNLEEYELSLNLIQRLEDLSASPASTKDALARDALARDTPARDTPARAAARGLESGKIGRAHV